MRIKGKILKTNTYKNQENQQENQYLNTNKVVNIERVQLMVDYKHKDNPMLKIRINM